MVSGILRTFYNICNNPYERLRAMKESEGIKIIGCHPMYVPEELVDAAGILPIMVLAQTDFKGLSDEYVQSNACKTVRGTFDLKLNKDIDFLDGMIFTDICDQAQWLTNIWKRAMPSTFHYSLALTHKLDSSGKEYNLKLFRRLKKALEEISGIEMTNTRLWKSIETYNENRALLRQLYDLRKGNPGILKARDIMYVVLSSMLMPKRAHSELLTELLGHLEKLSPREKEGIRLLAVGSPCEIPDVTLLDLIEDLGGLIIDDDFFVGKRYFSTDVPNMNDPLEALTERYASGIPCPTTHNPGRYLQGTEEYSDYAEFILRDAKENRVSGVLYFLVQHCDPHGFEYPTVKLALERAEMPHFPLETGIEKIPLESARVRLQAFMEILQQK